MKRLRILLVCDDLPARAVGGLGKHVVSLGNALLAGGHDVLLLGRDQPSYASCASEMGFIGRFEGGFADPWRSWFEHRMGCFNPLKRTINAKRIAASIRSRMYDFDVVHYHGHHPAIANYLPKKLNFLQTRHDQGSDCIIYSRFKNGEICFSQDARDCASCANLNPGAVQTLVSARVVVNFRRQNFAAFKRHPVIFVSDFLRKNYLKSVRNAGPGVKSLVVHNFTDEEVLALAGGAISELAHGPSCATSDLASNLNGLASRSVGYGPVRVLHMAGRLDETKGILEFLKILLPRMPPDWRIRVFGDGPQHQELRALRKWPQLQWFGHRPVAEVVASAASADACVVPSVWEEPCATVALEALRLGKVCFALARGGTPELMRYGGPGQLMLFSTLPKLVDGVLAGGYGPFAGPSESADVRLRMRELVFLYRQGMLRTGWSSGLCH